MLVIDDMETNLVLIQDFLTPIGFTCFIAKSAVEGFRLLYEQKPDIVLMDLRMPGMSGEEALQKIREEEQFKHLPVIAITASGFMDTKHSMLDLGFNACLFKPIDIHELLEEIATQLSLFYQYKEVVPKEQIDMEKGISAKGLSASIWKLKSASIKKSIVDSIELMNLAELVPIIEKSDLSKEEKLFVINQIEDKNYAYFLALNEQLDLLDE